MAQKHTTQGGLGYGLWTGNPLLRLALGICPALAVTTRAVNGLGLGVATACVLVCTSLIMAILGRFLTEKGRLPVTMLVSAAFAAVAGMVLKGWQGELYQSLGIFAPLMAVNTVILCRAGDYAAQKGVGAAIADSVGMGVGYILALTVLGIVRELIGSGAVFGARVLPAGYEPMLMAVMPAGGFLALGILMGICNAVVARGGKEDSK